MKKIMVNLKEILIKAKIFNYAVAQINTNNFESTRSILEAAEETATPIIIGVSESSCKYQWGMKNVVDMINNMIEYKNITVPVVLHLDHGSLQGCKDALKAGFTSVMYDGSHEEFDVNLANTKIICKLAKKYNASVEVELGSFGKNNSKKPIKANLEECIQISSLPIDALAIGFGSIHGVYPKNWKGLDFNLLNNIASNVSVPLVLHGGSGINDSQIKKAISLGISKINVNTEVQLSFAKSVRKYFKQNKDKNIANKGYDSRNIFQNGIIEMKLVCMNKFKQFGSHGASKK